VRSHNWLKNGGKGANECVGALPGRLTDASAPSGQLLFSRRHHISRE
jgi:hypothetical protein